MGGLFFILCASFFQSWCAVTLAGIAFLIGLITRNYSSIDRLWSVLPWVYAFVWLKDLGPSPRMLLAGGLVLLSGLRLTSNFLIKGGYRFSWRRGFYEEDYRWAVLRKKIPNRVLFELFNFAFISFFQSILIWGFTLPLYYYGSIPSSQAISTTEWLLLGLYLVLLLTESTADLQQLRYYRRRNQAPWSEHPRYQLGFNTFGLWQYSRHPNYICELGQWVTLYLLLVSASGSCHWSGSGALALILLFIGSTRMAEQISASKYPRYREWQRITSCWIPLKSWVHASQRRAFFASASQDQT